MYPSHSIVIRHSLEEDVRALAGLAILDSRPELRGPALIVEVDGVARVALDLSDGSVAADPFAPTTELVELLRLRARGIAVAQGERASWRSRVRAIAPPAARALLSPPNDPAHTLHSPRGRREAERWSATPAHPRTGAVC